MNTALSPRGWQARLDLRYGLRGAKTRLVGKRQQGPLTLQRALYPEGGICHSYLLHPPGGVVGGDSLDIAIRAGAGSHALLTTPGASKFYRSDQRRVARVNLTLDIEAGGTLDWLPQQNIFFPGTHAALDTRVNVAAGGRYAGWEIHCFGRPANQEPFADGEVRSQTCIVMAGELRLVERLNSHGLTNISAATGLRGLPMQGSFIAAPCSPQHREALVRTLQMLQEGMTSGYACPIGITLVDEILVVRTLGERAEPIQTVFAGLWAELRRLWLGTAPPMPRIWAT